MPLTISHKIENFEDFKRAIASALKELRAANMNGANIDGITVREEMGQNSRDVFTITRRGQSLTIHQNFFLGTDCLEVCKAAALIAQYHQMVVNFRFNEIKLLVSQSQGAEIAYGYYHGYTNGLRDGQFTTR